MPIDSSMLGPDFEKVVRDAIAAVQPVADSGVAVAVLKDGKLCFSGGFGLRDRAAAKAVDSQTVFAVGSATKAFTSMVLSMYAGTRAISLSDPVMTYLPDFQMQEGRTSTDMTLVDILSHRTGLPRHDPLWYLGPFTRSQLYYRLRYLAQIPGAFRTTFLYNNIMYSMAGHLLASHSGTSWEDFVQKHILDPLHMADTTFTLAAMLQSANYAKGYIKQVEVPLKDFTNIGPAGEINSNVIDMAKWVRLFLDKGVAPDGTVLIDPARLEHMYTGLTNVGNGRTQYGMGWYVDEVSSHRHIFHNGTADGNTAYVSFMPDRGLGVIVLTNQHCTTDLIGKWPDKVAEPIYDYLLNGQLAARVRLPELPAFDDGIDVQGPWSPATSTVAAAPAGDYVGMFSDDGYGDMAVSQRGAGLEISYYGTSWPLQHATGDVFVFNIHAFASDFKVPVMFSRDIGKVVALHIPFQKGVDPVAFTKR
jgi:CubicO group peptidase (beta-lactamase class C family)